MRFVGAQDLMLTLWRTILGVSSDPLKEEVYPKVRDGIWVLYEEAAQGNTEDAPEILEYVEHDRKRLAAFKERVEGPTGQARPLTRGA